MRTNKLLADIISIVETDLKDLGFRKTKGIYVFPIGAEDALGWLGLNTATHRGDGRIGINPVVGVRHERIEKLVTELLGEKEARLAPTISTALGYVMPERQYLEWLFEPTPFDYRSECNRMVQAVEVYGIPFMKSNAKLEVILQDLEHLRFSTKDMAIYRSPIAQMLTGETESAVAYTRKQLELLGDREDIAAQQYKSFAGNFFQQVSLSK